MSDVIYKLMSCETEFTKGKKGEEYFLATVSTGDVDRDGDILEPKGLDVTDYNRTVLYRHNRTMGASAEETLPVGRVMWEKVRGNKVKMAVEFNQKTKLSQLLHEFYKEKLMEDWSVGFQPVDGEVESITDEDGRITGRHIKKWKLHELSAVPVGANQHTGTEIARMKEIQKEIGLSDEAYLELFPEEKENAEEIEDTEKEKEEESIEEIDEKDDEDIKPQYIFTVMEKDITELKNEILILSKKLDDLTGIVKKQTKGQEEADITYPDDYLELADSGDLDDTGQESEQVEENEDEVILELFDENSKTEKEEENG